VECNRRPSYLKNRHLLGLISDLFVVWNGTVALLRHMRHFQVRIYTSLCTSGQGSSVTHTNVLEAEVRT
jgi:hypothetical protein